MRRLAFALPLLVAPAVAPAFAQETPPAAPPPAAPPAAPAPAWLPRQAAMLTLLDKVAARSQAMTLPLGQPGRFQSLTITVRACDVRPPDMAADATAWLDVTDANPGGPGFHGWLVASAPAVSGLAHPTYDVRLVGCR